MTYSFPTRRSSELPCAWWVAGGRVQCAGAAHEQRVCRCCAAVAAGAHAEICAFGNFCCCVCAMWHLLTCMPMLFRQVTLFLFPISFFYYFLFYTDTCSTMSLVLLQYLSTLDEKKPATPNVVRQIMFTLVRSEEHTSELQSLMRISYAVF